MDHDGATSSQDLDALLGNPLVLVAFVGVGVGAAVDLLTPYGALLGLAAGLLTGGVGFLLLDRSAPARLHRATGIGPVGLALAVVLVGLALGGTHLLGDPRAFCAGWIRRGCLTLYGWGSALFAAGTLGVAILVGHYPRYRQVAGTPVTPAADVVGGGPAAVVGRVERAGDTLTAPGSGDGAVWYHSEVAGPDRRPTGPAAVETDGTTFYVTDGSGRVLVEPAGADPYLLREYAGAVTVEGGRDGAAGDRRTWAVGPGDVVLVAGEAVPTDRAAWPEPVVLGLDGEPAVVPAARDRVVADLRWRVRAASALTLLLAGGGFGLMLLGL